MKTKLKEIEICGKKLKIKYVKAAGFHGAWDIEKDTIELNEYSNKPIETIVHEACHVFLHTYLRNYYEEEALTESMEIFIIELTKQIMPEVVRLNKLARKKK